MRRWLPWLALAVVVVVSLGIGASGSEDGTSDAARASRLSRQVRCPTCRGLSAAESDAKAAQAVRTEIRSRVEAGQTDQEIRAYLASRYGDDILLRPEGSGTTALVWALPVVVFICGGAGLAFAFRRWKKARHHVRRQRARTVATVLGVLLLASLAGLLVAQMSGERVAGRPSSGGIDEGTSDKLARAQQLVQEGKVLEAVKQYDAVLRDDPRNPVALAQRGWVIRNAGLVDDGLEYIDRAVAADPNYPEAHFFRAMILWRDKGDAAAAVGEFRLFLAGTSSSDDAAQVQPLLDQALAEAEGRAPAATSTVPQQ